MVSLRTNILRSAYSIYLRYWFWTHRLGGRGAIARPPSTKWNAVLQSRAEWRLAVAQAHKLGWLLHPDSPKNWDTLIALDVILQNTTPGATVLDAGAEQYSSLLPCLTLYGYRNLHGINLTIGRPINRGPIKYEHGDITATDFATESIDAITCLSVIEHGVNLEAYFKEMSRILKPGGVLISSTDYWEHKIDTNSLQTYGTPVKVFTLSEINELLQVARVYGLESTGEQLDLECKEKCVTWKRLGLRYTFVIFTLRKTCQNEKGLANATKREH